MSNRGIAYRRQQLERRKGKWRSIITRWQSYLRGYYSDDDVPALVGIMATTPCRCSGPCCGNERKWFHKKSRDEMIEREIETTQRNQVGL